MKSGRVFDELEIYMESFDKQDMDKLIAIAEEHGSTIKQLTMENHEMSNYEVDAEDLIKFFQNLPNLNNWAIYGDYDIFSDIIGKCEPVLKQLKTFTVREEGLNDNFFEKLSPLIASDTIESLDIHIGDNYENFITRQRRLKSIEVDYLDLNKLLSVTSSLQLEEIQCNMEFCDDEDEDVDEVNNGLLQLIREQGSLLKINFYDLQMSATVVETICQQSRFLRSLSLKLSNDNTANLLEIYQLKQLQELQISTTENFWRVDLLTELTKLEMANIKKVEFLNREHTNIELDLVVENLGKNWKNIEEFTIGQKVKTINSILQNLRNLKSLTVYDGGKHAFENDGCVYPLLERLEIFNYSTDPDPHFTLPIHFLQSLPNLSYLQVKKCLYEGASQINVLKQMQKLKKLEMFFIINSSETIPTLDDVPAIRKLCRTTKEFDITFSTPPDSKFTQELATLMKNERDVIKQTRGGIDFKTELKLESFKY